MRRWQAAFSMLLIGCSLDSAPSSPKQDSTSESHTRSEWTPEKLDAGARDDASRPSDVVDAGRVDQSSANSADAASPSGNADPMSKPSKPSNSTPASMTTKPADPPPSAAGGSAPADQPAGGMAAPSAGAAGAASQGASVAGSGGANGGAGGESGSLSDRLIDVAWRTVANPQVEWLQRWRQAAGASGPGLSADLVKAVLGTLLVQCARDPRQCVETCTLVESDCGACAADMECAQDFKNTCGLLGAKCASPTKPNTPMTP